MLTKINLKEFDWLLFWTVIILAIFGFAMIYSATSYVNEGAKADLYKSQLVWIGLAIVFLVVGSLINLDLLFTLTPILYFFSLLLLIAVYFQPAISGSQRWIILGPLRFQASELAKFATIAFLAYYITNNREQLGIKGLVVLFAITLVPFGLIIKEPDLGTSLCFLFLVFPMIYWAKVPFRYLVFILTPAISVILGVLLGIYDYNLFLIVGLIIYVMALILVCNIINFKMFSSIAYLFVNIAALVSSPFFWGHLKEYQQKRILTFLSPMSDPLGSGWQALQSKIAVGSGKLLGKGYLNGTQKKLAFLPENHTDFIFSVIGEELGFVGSLFLIFLFFIIVYKSISFAYHSQNKFNSYLSLGIGAIFVFHIFENIGMNIGIMPITGVPLPFISYGGSNLLISAFLAGLLLNIGAHKKEY